MKWSTGKDKKRETETFRGTKNELFFAACCKALFDCLVMGRSMEQHTDSAGGLGAELYVSA